MSESSVVLDGGEPNSSLQPRPLPEPLLRAFVHYTEGVFCPDSVDLEEIRGMFSLI